MKSKTILKYTFLFFAFTLFLASCADDNFDEIEEIEETIEEEMEETVYEMQIVLRNDTTVTDAFGAYCDQNGVTAWSVSNNLDLLGNDLWTGDINDGDFVIHFREDANSAFTLGGTIISSDVNGQTFKTLSLTDESLIDVTVDTANSTEIIGSMSGTFLVLVDPIQPVLDTVSFAVNFAADIDPALIPIFCE